MRYGNIRSEGQMREWVNHLMDAQASGTDLPFAVILKKTGMVAGATRYLNISPENRSVEIGGTWYSDAFQRTGVNTESKYLLLKHAFETLACVRVQFKTDSRNIRSQQALDRIGAIKEGELRNHMILPDGYIRTSMFYSIIDREWPAVKAMLEAKMASYKAV
jgi:RimJ/RimL family protein N-acetyltransferase